MGVATAWTNAGEKFGTRWLRRGTLPALTSGFMINAWLSLAAAVLAIATIRTVTRNISDQPGFHGSHAEGRPTALSVTSVTG